MAVIRVLVSVFVIFSFSVALDLPSYFTKCKKSDPQLSECIKKNLNESWSRISQGDSKYHILPLDPLHIPFMQIKVDANLYGNMTNGQVDGISTAQFNDVKFDLENRKVDFYYLLPICSVHGKYDISGKIFGLPLTGQGDTNITSVNAMYHYIFEYDLKERGGKQYIEMTTSNVNYDDIERVYFHSNFANNRLGDEINKVLNENWRELNKEVVDSIGLAFGAVFKMVFQEFFKKVPFDYFFAEE